jgi:hypothetical protein
LDFAALPYNTSRIYTYGVAKSGCKVYAPAWTHEDAKLLGTVLQTFLDSQPAPPQPRPLTPPQNTA